MEKYYLLSAILFLAVSCKTHLNSDRHYDIGKEERLYALRLDPVPGSQYFYTIGNESEVKMEIGDRKMDNVNKSDVGSLYTIRRDSMGDFVLGMTYEKIHLYSKKNGEESEMDAANATTSLNPLEKMLGALQSAHLEAHISPAGEVKSVTGYKEIGEKLLAGFHATDSYSQNMARSRVEQVIGDGIVKKNMDQLFRIFPDSAVHIGDSWHLHSVQKGDFSLHVNSTLTLVSVSDGVATIDADAELKSDSGTTQMMGYEVSADLKGHQTGTYQMETATGMLLSSTMKGTVEGTIQLMGRDVPVTIETKLTIIGRRKEGK